MKWYNPKSLFYNVLLFLIFFSLLISFDAKSFAWIHLLIFSGIMIWLPIVLKHEYQKALLPESLHQWVLPAGLFHLPGLLLPNGWWAGLFSLPWLLLAIAASIAVIKRSHIRQAAHLIRVSAYLFWIVGAFWNSCSHFGVQPLNFSPVIVLLTAAHFHFAGFLLTSLLVYLVESRTISSYLTSILFSIELIAIPLTAVGIVLTHYTGQLLIESIGGIMTAIAGGGISLSFFYLGIRKTRALWIIGSTLLFLGMVLAFLYASRGAFPIAGLDIPFMYRVHGSTNALALGLLVLQTFLSERQHKRQRLFSS